MAPPQEYYLIFFITSQLNSHGTTDIKPDMLSSAHTGKETPYDKYNLRSIAHVHTNRKDDILMQRRLGNIFICILEWDKGLVKNQDCTRSELTQPWLCLFFLSISFIPFSVTTFFHRVHVPIRNSKSIRFSDPAGHFGAS